MVKGRSRLESHLPHLLLLITVAELAIYRLLVPGMRPRVDITPPLWHSVMTYVGLFLFYFASALALGVVAHQLRQVFLERKEHARIMIWMLLPAGSMFLVLATLSIVAVPSGHVTFLLEALFVAAIVAVVVAQLTQKGDLGARLGLILIALPLVVHFYAPFSLRYIDGEEVLFNGLLDDMDQAGRWLVLLAALTMPYCFGARPFLQRAARIGPLMAALSVGLLGALLIRHDYVKGMELAQNGLGFAVGPVAPGSFIALCLLALSAVVWTVTGCVSAPSENRRTIGVGLGLVVVGGYAFTWPLQYLVGLAGLLAISRSASKVKAEEQTTLTPIVPAIEDEVWQGYMGSVLADLRKSAPDSEPVDDEADEGRKSEQATVVTIRGEGGQSRSHFVYKHEGMPVTVTVERISGSIVGLDVRCGEGKVEGAPAWSLHADQASAIGLIHPAPPKCKGRVHTQNSEPFDAQFQVLDSGGWSEVLLEGDMCDQLIKRVSGWVACWDDGTLRFQVYPGRGAPLDRPIPITSLAFGREDTSSAALIELLLTLVDLAQRAHEHAVQA